MYIIYIYTYDIHERYLVYHGKCGDMRIMYSYIYISYDTLSISMGIAGYYHCNFYTRPRSWRHVADSGTWPWRGPNYYAKEIKKI